MENITSLKRKARTAGILYLLLAVTAIYGYMIVQPKIIVSGDVAATAKNMLTHETLFRSCVATGLITNVLFVCVVMLLYGLFRDVNVQVARLMVGLVTVAIPVSLVADSLKITALLSVKGEAMQLFPLQQLQDWAVTQLKIVGYSSQVLTLFWGLWLLPLGYLVYRSGFIPRILGVLLLINGSGYVVSCFTFILFPEHQATISRFIYPTYFMGEIPLIFWLVIKGVRDHLSITVVSERETRSRKGIGKLQEQAP